MQGRRRPSCAVVANVLTQLRAGGSPGQVCEFSFLTRGSASVGLLLHRGQQHQEWTQVPGSLCGVAACACGAPACWWSLLPDCPACGLEAPVSDADTSVQGPLTPFPQGAGRVPAIRPLLDPSLVLEISHRFCFTGRTRTDTGARSNYGKVEAAAQRSAERRIGENNRSVAGIVCSLKKEMRVVGMSTLVPG